MITDNDDGDHVTMFIVMEKVLEFGELFFFLHRSLSLATKPPVLCPLRRCKV